MEEEKEHKPEGEAEQPYKEQFIRVSADFKNYKRRIGKERLEWMLDAQVDILKPLLTVVGDLDRGIDALAKQEETEQVEEIRAGLELIKKNVEKKFAELGVEEIVCSGDFDPNLHEALLWVDSDKASGAIVEVLSRGYIVKGRVIKYAKVSVAK